MTMRRMTGAMVVALAAAAGVGAHDNRAVITSAEKAKVKVNESGKGVPMSQFFRPGTRQGPGVGAYLDPVALQKKSRQWARARQTKRGKRAQHKRG